MKHLIKSLKGMDDFALSCAKKFSKITKKNSATIVGLYGDLGSGKTTFVKSLAKAYGITEHITSPTFVIMKFYPPLIHIDAYRLKSGEELITLGWEKIVSDPKNFICIEWPENVADIMPKDHIVMKFAFVDENTREVIELD
ncbi:MAG: tRNA (adenosine(37)-N6)-threonylcarbamoyltransferase complex ATPase subunit type 1 TsaE [Patescibacteria group bacterium]|nr:tRNA (adenosine(37)-N6)-threonylcarbamoyltransferase complex ATPase subunit type 1 TsaE [Patescibacteria group bacterium]